jgi:SAM-dependent methyltransferase
MSNGGQCLGPPRDVRITQGCWLEYSLSIAINVEASHCYADVPRFLAEVQRVLTPGGLLLFADFRRRDPEFNTLRRQIAGAAWKSCWRRTSQPAFCAACA